MKTAFLNFALVLFLCPITAVYCQAGLAKGIVIETQPYNEDLSRLLNFQKTDYHKLKLSGEDLKDKDYRIVTKEMIDGKITKTDTLIDTSTNQFLNMIEADSLDMYALGSKTNESKLRVEIAIGILHLIREYDCVSDSDYSLRYLSNAEPIEPNKPFYLFAYIVPYEKNGIQFYCLPHANGNDVESWGKQFGIKHLILFEMTFYNNKSKPENNAKKLPASKHSIILPVMQQ